MDDILITMRPLRIAIATSGRFHVLDLARELADRGHKVCLYSMLPNSRVEHFGLHRRYHRSLLPYVAPFAGWQKYAPEVAPSLRNYLSSLALDQLVSVVLEPCDVFIGMSGIFVKALKAARKHYGARIWLERGSQHILSQAEILAAVPKARRPSKREVARELEGYCLADRIVVPSLHVADSFKRDPTAHAKLFVNPYGTNIDMFPCNPPASANVLSMRLIYAGNWSYRKGCDLLTLAVKSLPNVSLVHVGAILDAKFPTGETQFEHHNPVPQAQLGRFYATAHAFVLASREDGFGMVLAQALAAGLPVICTDRTGGMDLRHTPALRDRITIVPNGDVEALRDAIAEVTKRLRFGPPYGSLEETDRASLAWRAYARRYSDELLADLQRTNLLITQAASTAPTGSPQMHSTRRGCDGG